MSDGQTFQAFWFGQLTACERLCIKSFLDNGHRYVLYSYDRDVDVPGGTEIADAGQIYPRDPVFFYANGSVSAFSNMFRWRLLYEKGGWWVDTDVFCLTPRLPSEPYAWAQQEPGIVNGAILKFPKNDALCRKLLKKARKRRRKEHAFGAITFRRTSPGDHVGDLRRGDNAAGRSVMSEKRGGSTTLLRY